MGTTTAATVPIRQDGDRVGEDEYRRLALGDGGRSWELHQGRLREKPGMSVEHGDLLTEVLHLLRRQLDRNEYRLRANHARLRRSAEHYSIPDVVVVPTALERSLRRRPGTLDAYDQPMPLVVEIWSPSTGDYDQAEKLPEYQRRGDREIWRLHPYERTLRVWRRRPDGTYDETTHSGGVVRPGALPGVVVDLDALFEG